MSFTQYTNSLDRVRCSKGNLPPTHDKDSDQYLNNWVQDSVWYPTLALQSNMERKEFWSKVNRIVSDSTLSRRWVYRCYDAGTDGDAEEFKAAQHLSAAQLPGAQSHQSPWPTSCESTGSNTMTSHSPAACSSLSARRRATPGRICTAVSRAPAASSCRRRQTLPLACPVSDLGRG
jgi:hypothetical protein